LIHNCDAAGKYHSNIFGLLIGIGMDVAFGFPEFGKTFLFPFANTAIVGRDKGSGRQQCAKPPSPSCHLPMSFQLC
jgi:hypothetical protein